MFRILTVVILVIIGSSDGRRVKSFPISSGNNWLTLRLLQELNNGESNVVFSPFSISTVMGMLFIGTNDKTSDELREVLGYKFGSISNEDINEEFATVLRQMEDIDQNKYQLNVANKIVVQKDFDILQTFKDNLKKYYQTFVGTADFESNSELAMDTINEWVKHETHQKIHNLLSQPLSPSTRLVLLNAIHFKGLWKTKFVESETHEEVFFNNGNNEVKTQMMRRVGKFNFTEIPELDSNLLEIPYSGEDMSLYIVLPNQRQGLQKVRTDLNDFTLIEKSITQLREVEKDVVIPKFKILGSHSLKHHLMALGMKRVFTSEADLSGIDGKKDLFLSDVLHKAVIEVNEEGSEAAVVTSGVVGFMSVRDEPQCEYFRADHPFVFFIRDNRNGMILFCGHINRM